MGDLVLHKICHQKEVRDFGVTFSAVAIEINSFFLDVFSKTSSFTLYLYVSRGFLLDSMFELLSILSKKVP